MMANSFQKLRRQLRAIINDKYDAEVREVEKERHHHHQQQQQHQTGNEDPDQTKFSRCKPESIEKLCRTTRFTKEELQIIYRGFKQQCPNGFLREETLKNIFASFFPQGDSSEYAHYVFLTLDSDKSGSISFEKFILTLSILSRGTIEEKLRWVFQLYDFDGDGYISKEELILVATSIYHLMGKWTRPTFNPEIVEDHIVAVLKKMNSDKEGFVSFSSFLAYCLGDRTVLESMKAMETTISGGSTAAASSSLTAGVVSPSLSFPLSSHLSLNVGVGSSTSLPSSSSNAGGGLPAATVVSKFGPGTNIIDVVVDESPAENEDDGTGDQILPAITIHRPTTDVSSQRHSSSDESSGGNRLLDRSRTSSRKSRLKSLKNLF